MLSWLSMEYLGSAIAVHVLKKGDKEGTMTSNGIYAVCFAAERSDLLAAPNLSCPKRFAWLGVTVHQVAVTVLQGLLLSRQL